jgi:hypothetical protein
VSFVGQNFRQQFADADFVVDDEDVSHGRLGVQFAS